MKNFFTLFILSALLLIPNIGKATDYTIGEEATTYSYTALPIRLSGLYGAKYSISQQIYLASELIAEGASEGDISAIRFYYGHADNTTITRNIEVWIMETSLSQFSMTVNDPGKLICNSSYKAGTQVFDGSVTLQKESYVITFNKNGGKFPWGGSNNILITVFDKTGEGVAQNRHVIMATENPRFLHKVSTTTPLTAWNINDLYNTTADTYTKNSSEIEGHKWVNKITFTIDDGEEPEPPATPINFAVSAISINTATLSWSSSYDATSYDLQQSANGEDWSTLSLGETGTSYNWTGLSSASTQYARIRANNAVGSSNWSDAITVTTDAVHEHDGITFDKWSTSNALPTSGNYYIYNDVSFDAYASETITLTGNMNLCLNGNSVDIQASHIIIPNGKTLTIYDNVGTGSLSGFYESTPASAEGLITVENGGTLVIKEGSIQNLDVDPNDGYLAYAIYNKGTLRISGDPVISGHDADISLFNNKYITLDGALTNTAKYSVNAGGQTITSGWSTYMSGEKPSDYFESAKSGYDGICVVSNEAKLVKLLALDEDDDNDAISDGTYSGTICVNMTRSLTSSQYNTFCLPFALDDDQLQEFFGAGYDLEEFVSSSLEGDVLNLVFNKVTSLEAGKPYLLQPSVDVVNPSFEGVTIAATEPADQKSDANISFHATFAPTELEGGNRNLLFLGADNELFYPASTANIKAFRAYFELKGAAVNSAPKARIVKKQDSATGIENQMVNGKCGNGKFLKDGQLYILREGKMYNVLGMEK